MEEEEDRETGDGEGRGGNKMEKRKQLYRDPWVAEKLLVEKVTRSRLSNFKNFNMQHFDYYLTTFTKK